MSQTAHLRFPSFLRSFSATTSTERTYFTAVNKTIKMGVISISRPMAIMHNAINTERQKFIKKLYLDTSAILLGP